MTDRLSDHDGWDEEDPALAPAAEGGGSDAPSSSPPQECGRCRKLFDAALERCPICGARSRDAAPQAEARVNRPPTRDEFRAIKIIIWSFAWMLLQSVLFSAGLSLAGDADPLHRLIWVLILEAIDTVIVVIAAVLLWNQPAPSDPERPLAAWLLAWPALAAGLAVNLAYHRFIHQIGIPIVEQPVNLDDPLLAGLTLLTICIQPALIEEWFFRGLVWKTFREFMGPQAAVWVIAVMFGMAHIGVFLSVPVLILIGALFGYARLYSGGLLLPILLHFVHNLAVTLWEVAS
jgi:membrane protease YdiL (CAAX protease family)